MTFLRELSTSGATNCEGIGFVDDISRQYVFASKANAMLSSSCTLRTTVSSSPYFLVLRQQ